MVIPEASLTIVRKSDRVIIKNRYCPFECLHQGHNGEVLGSCDRFRREPTGVKLCFPKDSQ